MFSYWARPSDCADLCRMLNDHVAACVATNPQRFVGACDGRAREREPRMRCRRWVHGPPWADPDPLATCPSPRAPSPPAGLCTLPMQSPELAVLELKRCVNELHLAGVQ